MSFLGAMFWFGAGWWIETLAFARSQPITTSDPEGDRSTASPWIPALRSYIRSLVFTGAAIIVLASALLHDSTMAFAISDWFASRAVTVAVVMILLGFWASRYRSGLLDRAERLFKAFLGEGANPPWALQSLVAIIGVIAVTLVVKPDILDRVQSIKAGDFEAKLASVTATTSRTVVFGLYDYARDNQIDKWDGFFPALDQGPRRVVSALFDPLPAVDLRAAIRQSFSAYIQPLAAALRCARLIDRIDGQRPRLVNLTASLRDLALAAAAGEKKDLEASLLLVLLDARRSTADLEREFRASPNASGSDPKIVRCRASLRQEPHAVTSSEWDKTTIMTLWEGAYRAFQQQDKLSMRLAIFDPYLIDAAADLMELSLNSSEKADFLVRIKKFYPDPARDASYASPGIINFYFQMAEAKLRSGAHWPLDELIGDLDRARSATLNILGTIDAELKARPDLAHSDFCGPNVQSVEQCISGVRELYLKNFFYVSMRYVETFDLRVLAGESLSAAQKESWRRAHSTIESAIQSGEGFWRPALNGARAVITPPFDLKEWTVAKLRADNRFDAFIILALSSILIPEGEKMLGAQNCNGAKFYLKQARSMKKTVEDDVLLDDDIGGRSRFEGYIQQAEERIAASCDR